MLQDYKDLIEKLFDNVFHDGNANISFGQYMSIIGMSLLLMLALVVFVGLIVGMVYLPHFIYTKLVIKETNKLNELVKQLSEYENLNSKEEKNNIKKEISNLEKSKNKKMIAFIFCLIVFYFPVAVPTILYIFTTFKNIL